MIRCTSRPWRRFAGALVFSMAATQTLCIPEELLFSSPQDINRRTKKVLQTLGAEALQAGNPHNLSSSCLHGLITCLWETEDNPVKGLAAQEAEARLSPVQPDVPSPTAYGLAATFAALLPSSVGSSSASASGGQDLEAQLRALPSSTGDVDHGLSGGEQQAPAEVQAHVRGLRVLEEIRSGAVLKAEALPQDVNQWLAKADKHKRSKDSGRFLAYLPDEHDYGWRLATREAWQEQKGGEGVAVNASDMAEMRGWLEENGGRVTYAMVDGGRLVASEAVGEGEVVVSVPLKLTLSSLTTRLVKTKRGLLKEYLDPVFARRQEWGLAVFLLYEHRKGSESRWWPFLRTLRMHVPGNAVLKELEGSFAGELYRRWEKEAQVLIAFLRRQGPCQHDFYGVCEGWLEPGALRWALWVVRRYAVAVRKATTGKDFLALVPMAHLLRHQPSAGGSVSLSLDNTVRVALGAAHATGEAVSIDRGAWGDADCLLRWHEVALEGRMNVHNAMHVALPAVAREDDDLLFGLDRNHEWRTLLRYPPKQIDLWIATNHLLLYGDSEDEEEQRIVENANKLLAGLPVTVKSEEERLMLLGAARDEDEARQLMTTTQGRSGEMVVGPDGSLLGETGAPQLYLALEEDGNEDDAPGRARQALAAAALDLQEAVMASSSEPSVQKCVNRTRDFFVHGVRPLRGLDEIDKLLKRKRRLLDRCGPTSTHVIQASGGASDHLLCAVRVLFVNESDLDVLCPPGEPPFHDMDCRCLRRDLGRDCLESEDHFNASRPISRDNEAHALQLLLDSFEGILRGYRTSVEDDEALLALSTVTERTPLLAAAVTTRLREKRMLIEALQDLRNRQAQLRVNESSISSVFQVESLLSRRQEAEAERARHEARVAELRAAASRGAPVVATVSVDLGGGPPPQLRNLTWREGEALDLAVQRFAEQHGVAAEGARVLLQEARKKVPRDPRLLLTVPVIDPLGVRRALTVREGENATSRAVDFCLAYNVSDHEADEACQRLATQTEALLAKRLKRKVLLTVPVNLVDGRSVLLDIRQGDEHDVVQAVSRFAAAYRMHDSYVHGLAQEVERRLPRPLVRLPVNVEGRAGLVLRVSSVQDLDADLSVFCEVNDLPVDTTVPVLRQRVLGMLNPGAMVMPGKMMMAAVA